MQLAPPVYDVQQVRCERCGRGGPTAPGRLLTAAAFEGAGSVGGCKGVEERVQQSRQSSVLVACVRTGRGERLEPHAQESVMCSDVSPGSI